MKIFNRIFRFGKSVKKWVSHKNNLITLILTVVSLYIAYKSLVFADLSFKFSVKQNEISSKNADSLFNVQLNTSKKLNDSLVKEINRLQIITDNQLKITEKQLIELKHQSKPKIVLTKFWINEYNDTDREMTISTTLINLGNREAYHLSYSSCLFQSDFTIVSKPTKGIILDQLNSQEEYNFEFKIKIPFDYIGNIYVFFQLFFYDKELGKADVLECFYKFEGIIFDGPYDNKCTQKEINNIKKMIRVKK